MIIVLILIKIFNGKLITWLTYMEINEIRKIIINKTPSRLKKKTQHPPSRLVLS